MDILNSQNYWTVAHVCINAGVVSLRLMTLYEIFYLRVQNGKMNWKDGAFNRI